MPLIGKSLFQRTHYEVLSVKEDAGYDEIRASYKAAALNSHPDKLNKRFDNASTGPDDLQKHFLDVQKAWEILSDSSSRANYDMELRSMRMELDVPANEIELEDMSVEADGDLQELSYECRCGDYFSITSAELEQMGIVLSKDTAEAVLSVDSVPTSVLIPCGSCSLKVRLMVSS